MISSEVKISGATRVDEEEHVCGSETCVVEEVEIEEVGFGATEEGVGATEVLPGATEIHSGATDFGREGMEIWTETGCAIIPMNAGSSSDSWEAIDASSRTRSAKFLRTVGVAVDD